MAVSQSEPSELSTVVESIRRGEFSEADAERLLDRSRDEVKFVLLALAARAASPHAPSSSTPVYEKLRAMRLAKAARCVEEGVGETLSYMAYPREHWTRLRTNNGLERLMREIRRRTRVVGAFPDGNSALMLVAARLRHVAGGKWGARKYLDMSRLVEHDRESSQNRAQNSGDPTRTSSE
ncbi:Transposase, Mutator family [Posidoniimonas corsicana]|uniref:Mutator family transposase n=1 Tax=Posidoniimonas corsicana TaxID=1938618 RepID=A0A5C5VC22_9BACT|nr:transposase [Posidoniimonas corsicana]TWT35252.1 Transposase, Mutator family [Posidoniimonas corsicana]